MPASALERSLFWADLTGPGDEPPTLLPLEQVEAVLGVQAAGLEAVLESGGPPVTVLQGAIGVREVRAAAQDGGYGSDEVGEWTLLTAERPAAAVPAAAVRRGTLVVGTEGDLRVLVEGGESAADAGWVPRVLRAVGSGVGHVILAPAPDPGLAEQVRRSGAPADTILARAGVRTPLAAYEGFAVAGPVDQTGRGVIALAGGPATDGHRLASELPVRLATAGMIGEPTRRLSDQLEAGGASWHAGPGVVRMPVEWERFDPAQLRTDVERGNVAFLVPSD